jgi:hypothetical protein
MSSAEKSTRERWEDIIGGPLEEGVENKTDCLAHNSVSGESLGVKLTDEGKILLTCRADCATEDVLDALGLTYADLYITNGHSGTKEPPKKASFRGATAGYEYQTPAGEPVSRAVRFPDKNDKKVVRQAYYYDNEWWWKKPEDFKPVPYNLPAVMRAVLDGQTLYIFEGEPDVHAAEEWGLVGTTNPGGAGKFTDDLAPYLRGADIVIVPDDDKPGVEHAQNVARILSGTARSIKVLPPQTSS